MFGITNNDVDTDPMFANITENDGSFVHDFSANYQLNDRFEIYGGINNAFEEEPYLGSLSRPAGPRGRFFFLGINAEL